MQAFFSHPARMLATTAISAAFTLTSKFVHAEPDQPLLSPAGDSAEVIAVVGTRLPSANLPVAAAIHVISRDDIDASGAQTLVQVLGSIAGLQINDSIGNRGRGSSISLRGFGENGVNNVLVLVDGRKLNNPSLAGPDLASISLAAIARIEILHGSAGSLYGDQATAGVINIITDQSGEAPNALALARGSDDSERYQLSVQDAFGDGWSYRLAGEKWLADHYRDNNQQNYGNLVGNLSYRRSNLSLGLDAQYTDDDLRLPGSLSAEQREQNPRQASTPADFGNRSTRAHRFALDWAAGENWQVLADLHDRSEQGNGALYGGAYRYQTEIQAAQPRIAGQFGNAQWLLGIDSERAESDSDYGFGVTQIEQRTDDWYGNLSLPLATRWTLSAGARQSEFDGEHNLAQTVHDTITVWNAGASVAITDHQRAFLRRDESFRWPTADENGFIAPTQSALAPQQAQSWELGWEWHSSELQTVLTLYSLAMQDEIFYDPTADGPFGPGTGANVNLDRSQRDGITLRGSWQIGTAVKTHFNASAVDARFDGGSFAGKTVPFVAEQQLGAGLSWQASDSIQLYADAQYTGERYFAGDNSNSGGPLGGYTLFNVSARWQPATYYLELRVDNAGDKRYDGFAGVSAWGPAYYYPAPGRELEVTVGFEF